MHPAGSILVCLVLCDCISHLAPNPSADSMLDEVVEHLLVGAIAEDRELGLFSNELAHKGFEHRAGLGHRCADEEI